jgi:uncharacterized membrane protein YphA (DoxX/SURF4 family)
MEKTTPFVWFAWVFQLILAVQFLAHGWLFVRPPAALVPVMESAGLGSGFRQFLGVAEILASAGLVLPAATRVLPWLTPLTTAGLTIVMVGATVYHMVRGEWWSVMGAVEVLALVTITGYLRWKIVPIPARGAPSLR